MNFSLMQHENIADAARKRLSRSKKIPFLCKQKHRALIINNIVFSSDFVHLTTEKYKRLWRLMHLTKCKQQRSLSN